MNKLVTVGLVVAFAASIAAAGTTTGAIAFTAAQLDTVIDQPTQDPIDYDISEPDRGAIKTGLGTFIDHATMNDFAGLGMGVVTFNSATATAEALPNKFEQSVNDAVTRRVDFTVVQGLGNYEDGYNFGGYSSGGRTAISGGATNDHLGLIPGNTGSGLGVAACVFAVDITTVGTEADEYVDMIGNVLIGKGTGQSATLYNPKMTVTIENLSTAATSTASIKLNNSWLGGNDASNAIFFGYRAPDNYKITRAVFDSDTVTGAYMAMDDLAFRLIPEPGTMALLGLGGLGALIRRRRR